MLIKSRNIISLHPLNSDSAYQPCRKLLVSEPKKDDENWEVSEEEKVQQDDQYGKAEYDDSDIDEDAYFVDEDTKGKKKRKLGSY